jgi:tetratricopeptide (TPR) repeat protein
MCRYGKQILLAGLLVLASAVQAAGANNQCDVKADMFVQLAGAKTESAGRLAESVIWEYWFDQSPTTEVRSLLDRGRERREAYDYEAAENLFDQVVDQAPKYHEGYNQRAFARFLRENYDGALADLEETLRLCPDHFGALSGMYHVLRIQNRHQTAMKMLQRAVAIHPWIQERGALPKALWPDSYRAIHEPGQEI